MAYKQIRRYTTFYFVFFLSLIMSVIASYDNIGQNNFYTDEGYFNSNLKSWDRYPQTLINSKYPPLVEDMNNDSVKEVFVLSNNNVVLYSGNKLLYKSTLSTSCTSSDVSAPVLFDIDGDNKKEFIYQCDKKILIINVTPGTLALNIQNSITVSTASATLNQSVIGCYKTQQCYIASQKYRAESYGNFRILYFFGFNTTGIGSVASLESSGATFWHWTAPLINYMPCIDLDKNGNTECIFTVAERTNTDDYNVRIYAVNASKLSATPTITYEKSNDDWTGVTYSSTYTYGQAKSFTAPTIWKDADGKNKVIIALNKDDNEFKLIMLNDQLALEDRFPKYILGQVDSDGQIVSNVFTGQFFVNGLTNSSFCVTGFSKELQKLSLVCGARSTGLTYDSYEFQYSTTGEPYNLSISNTSFITHVTNMEGNLSDNAGASETSQDLNEIITSYGIFTPLPNYVSSNDGLQVIYQLKKVFNNPEGESSTIISSDFLNDGRAELLIKTKTKLLVLDDGIINHPGYIRGNINLNPCINRGTAKINTSLNVNYVVADYENDTVCTRGTIYHGTPYNYSSSYICNPSWSEFSLNFVLNRTINNGILKLEAYDTGNPTIKNSYNITYSVGNNGVSFGECSSVISGVNVPVTSSTGKYNQTSNSKDSNIAKDFLETVDSSTGLGTTVIWLILSLLLSLIAMGVLIFGARGFFGGYLLQISFALFVIIFCTMLVIGAKLGFISAGIIITFVVIGFILISIGIGKLLTGNSNNNG